MSLMKCKECGAEISNTAKSCPSCGAVQKKGRSALKWVFWITTFLVFIAVFSDDGRNSSSTQGSSDASEREKEDVWMVKGQEAVRAKLKDGESARFEGVFFHRGQDGMPMTCGKVNSKNSLGAYGGYQRFVSAGREDLTFLEEEVTDFQEVWNRLCG